MAQYYIKDVIRSMLNMDEETADKQAGRSSVVASEEENEIMSLDSAGSPLLRSRGCSIREFEQQLSGLRKENFNLKLRIYFLEERMESNYNMDKEDAVKKNIELMVEQESLKSELHEKQDLLCQAVKAMELEEDEHRKEIEKKEKQLRDMRQQLESFHHQCDNLQEEVHLEGESHEGEYVCSPMNMAEQSQAIIALLENRIAVLEQQLRAEKSAQIQSEAASLMLNIEQLKAGLRDRDDKLQDAQCELADKCIAFNALQSKMTAKEMELREKNNEVSALKRKLEQTVIDFKRQQLTMEELQKLNEECAGMLEREYEHNERNRLAIGNRNAKIAELESSLELYQTEVANLELKLETAANGMKKMRSSQAQNADYSLATRPVAGQVQRKSSSPNYKSKNNRSSASGDEAADTLCSQLLKYKRHVNSLEADQLKACHIIQTLLETRKKNCKEIEELQRLLQKRDAIITDMRERLGENGAVAKSTGEKKSIQERVSELNLTAAAPSSDTESATPEDGYDPHLLLEQYRLFINEIDSQKKMLSQSLNMMEEKLNTKALLLEVSELNHQIASMVMEAEKKR